MKVRVKDDRNGFFDGMLRREGAVFEIEAKTHYTKTDEKGNPLVISEEEQFSAKWMERVDKPRAKPGPKPKVVEE